MESKINLITPATKNSNERYVILEINGELFSGWLKGGIPPE